MKAILFAIFLSLIAIGCNDILDVPSESNEDFFLALWKHIDINYCFFPLKGINWDSIKTAGLERIRDEADEKVLFTICSDIIHELKDGHATLSKGAAISKYYITQGYDIHFDLDLVQGKYLNSYNSGDNYTYGVMNDSIGSLHLSGFPHDFNIETIIEYFKTNQVQKIIIDLRNNTGGSILLAQEIVEYLINGQTNIGYMRYKTGKGHNDLTVPLEIIASPKPNNYHIKTNIIINRRSYSAASFLSGKPSRRLHTYRSKNGRRWRWWTIIRIAEWMGSFYTSLVLLRLKNGAYRIWR